MVSITLLFFNNQYSRLWVRKYMCHNICWFNCAVFKDIHLVLKIELSLCLECIWLIHIFYWGLPSQHSHLCWHGQYLLRSYQWSYMLCNVSNSKTKMSWCGGVSGMIAKSFFSTGKLFFWNSIAYLIKEHWERRIACFKKTLLHFILSVYSFLVFTLY